MASDELRTRLGQVRWRHRALAARPHRRWRRLLLLIALSSAIIQTHIKNKCTAEAADFCPTVYPAAARLFLAAHSEIALID
jgi:hypothetical protein